MSQQGLLHRCRATPIARRITISVVASLLSALLACDARKDTEGAATIERPKQTESPAVEAPSPDGHLYVLGNDAACLEFTLDAEVGELTLRVWNAKRNKLMRLKTQWVEIQLAPMNYTSESQARGRMTLLLMAEPTRWEKLHRAGEFSAVAPRLRGLESFVAVLGQLKLRGIDFAGVEIEYPAKGIVYTQEEGG